MPSRCLGMKISLHPLARPKRGLPALGVFEKGSSFPRDVTNGATPDPAAQQFSPLLNMSKISNYPKKRGPREDDSWNRGRVLTPLFRYGGRPTV